MSDIFELDSAGWDQRIADARLSAPAAYEPGFFDNALKATGQSTMKAFARTAQTIGILGGVGMSLYERATGQEGRFTDPYFREVDEYATDAVDFWTPDARTTGTAGRVLGGLTETLLPLAVAGGNPVPMILNMEVGTATDLSREGVDPKTAVGVGAIQGASGAVGVKIPPAFGTSIPTRVLTGAAGNTLLNTVTTYAQQQALEMGGYDDLAQLYDPLDAEARTVDLLIGAAFGGLPHTPAIRPSDRNAILAGANARHFQVDAAPGHLKDVAAAAAHQRAMETAMQQMLNGEPVAISPEDIPRNVEPRPARDPEQTLAAVREVLGDIPEPADPLPLPDQPVPRTLVGDEAIRNPIDFDATPEVKLQQLKQLTEQNIPVVQKLVDDLNVALKGTESKLNVKEDAKILEKAARPSILAKKPWHGVEHIRDSLRFKTVIDRIDQLPEIVDVLKKHGIGVVKIDTAKLLDPGPWGWRIVALDLRLPNGQLVEHYMPLKELEAAKKNGGHELFEKWRNEDLMKLSPEQRAEYESDRAKSIALYQAAWEAAALRTGLDDTAALASLKSFATSAESLTSTVSSISAPVTGTSVRQTPSTRTAATSGESTKMVSGDSRNLATSGISSSEGILPKNAASGLDNARENSPDNQATTHKFGLRAPQVGTVEVAKEALEQADVLVATGEIDADGNPVTRSGREVIAEAEANIAKAEQDAVGYEAAVNCFLTRGFDNAA